MVDETLDEDEEVGDDFENLYKGEVSKSGVPILPSKRARKIPEKIKVSKDDLAELNTTSEPNVEAPTSDAEDTDVSLDELSEAEDKSNEENKEESETSNT